MSILLVEDNPTDALLLKQALKQHEFKGELLEAGSAEAGYRLLVSRLDEKKGLPGLVLLDLGLPAESGMSMLEKLKSTPVLSDMKVIVFSGSKKTQDMAQARVLGADWYFVKPQSPRDFNFVIQELERLAGEPS